MNKYIKGVIAVLIIIALLVGVYFILPGSIKYSLNQFYQENYTTDEAKLISEAKKYKVPGTEVTFDKALAKTCKSHNWYVETLIEGQSYKIHLNGYKVDVTYPKEDGTNNMHFTNTHIEYVFDVTVEADGTHKNSGWHFLVDGIEKTDYDKKMSAKSLAAKVN